MALGRFFWWSQPQRRCGRLHGLVDDCQQFGRQGAQLDLVPQAGAERRHRPGSVIAAPIEASVDQVLDAAPGGLEQGRHDQG